MGDENKPKKNDTDKKKNFSVITTNKKRKNVTNYIPTKIEDVKNLELIIE